MERISGMGSVRLFLGKKNGLMRGWRGKRNVSWGKIHSLSCAVILFLRAVAEDQYHEIISAPDAWLVTDEASEDVSHERELRSTNSARRMKALVEQVTGELMFFCLLLQLMLTTALDRYSPLPYFMQRTRFLISVQLPLLESYHSRISSSLDAFETLSSAFVRAVPGALGVSIGGGGAEGSVNVDAGGLTSGVDGVQRLCKALVSARSIEGAMEGWGEELVSPNDIPKYFIN
jgi:hypothetical protein